MIQVGQIVKIKEFKSKRRMGIVTKSDSYSCTIEGVYKPSPKSRLKNKTKFSKHKLKLLL